ncbi:MAG: hypothetical protein WAQ08_15805 [Aquabacterium sp.]|uniref:hypothetical protein n=1 Tax=Aquabacterium sp. TaxID=1872578 RepID=UPI003BAE8EF9
MGSMISGSVSLCVDQFAMLDIELVKAVSMFRSQRWRFLRNTLQTLFRRWSVKPAHDALQAVRGQRVLVLGIYLGDRFNLAAHLYERFMQSSALMVDQRWAAFSRKDAHPGLAAATTLLLSSPLNKFAVLNLLLEGVDLAQYDLLIVSDDDVFVPDGFLDTYVSVQHALNLDLAQPARAIHSFYDHRFTLRRPWLSGRLTRFVEIGPIFSMTPAAFERLVPFDIGSPMGWGLDLVWPKLMEDGRLGIVDRVSVDHSYRGQSMTYARETTVARTKDYLAGTPHVPFAQALVVLRQYFLF